MTAAEDGADLPHQVPFTRAARTPVGAPSGYEDRRVIDLLVIVIAPLLFPWLVLAITRNSRGQDVLAGFSLVDMAFGLAAVGFAVMVKAMADRRPPWERVGLVAFLAMPAETAIAIRADDMAATGRLTSEVAGCAPPCDLGELKELAVGIQQSAPSWLHWVAAFVVGAILCGMAARAIWKDL
ncbi:hypothetical protein JOD54_003683 [Actinokineospora baliensis]|uniref:hypothetical protein n=1 Tax=Actinokineospora baliensis TaxID=547056 RepID=UPI00195DF444|nr:hypothetical protein [Actinokineospora baliensis]MBM7773479.1 hypothetical protein [Actinokineospora baliensis]